VFIRQSAEADLRALAYFPSRPANPGVSRAIMAHMAATIRILIADDHALLRQGTTQLLKQEPDLEVVGEAGDGLEVVALTQKLRPEVVIMDLRMPGLSGLEATRRIRQLVPEARVLVLTAHDDDEYVISLLQAGAHGYLLKTSPINELTQAIRQVHTGGMPLHPAIARKLVLQLSGDPMAPPAEPTTDASGLTARELDVLQYLTQGLSNRQIGEALYISERTVQAHLSNIFSKLQVTSRVEAVLVAIRRGLFTLDSWT
jgi:DNA-binding NarL/FixJ family response regulator